MLADHEAAMPCMSASNRAVNSPCMTCSSAIRLYHHQTVLLMQLTMIDHEVRFTPASQAARDHMRKGSIGAIKAVYVGPLKLTASSSGSLHTPQASSSCNHKQLLSHRIPLATRRVTAGSKSLEYGADSDHMAR